ncbi:ABC transporter permease [Streptomyces sp. NBC_01092]|uniref:ABC transporter permease n=1 Tax=Streptomyces sp. NBC_01092 TaxID=2903748 RepID=UPI003867178C|nr:ABC transporter permease [Streptomyces sp. NBC_01092]
MTTAALDVPVRARRPRLRGALASVRTWVGILLTALVTAIAFLGPFLSPHGENDIVGAPYSDSAPGALLGTDYLGQDVWSRLLAGGNWVVVTAVLATLLGMVLGVAAGLVAGYARGWVDEVVMRVCDVVLAFPQIVLVLVLLSVAGPERWLVVVVVGVSHAPRVARLTRGMTTGLATREFVQSAEALGEKRSRILFAELLPNMTAPLLAELGLRLTYSVGLVASIGFLGFASDPSAADWGLMINENRLALAVQPWAILAPVLAIAVLALGTNLIADGIARSAAGADLSKGASS